MENIHKLKTKMLQEIAAILKKNNISYWLESGTLLGFLRDKDHLPDHPRIDIGIDANAQDRFINAAKSLGIKYRIKKVGNLSGRQWVEGPYTRFLILRAWEQAANAIVKAVITVKYKHGDQYRWIDQRSCKSIDADFYDKLDHITFCGTEYPIPLDPKNYLSKRYVDWETKNIFYQSRIDDLSIAGPDIIKAVPYRTKQNTKTGGKPKKIQLTGKYFYRMKKMLFEVLDIFDHMGITYWLDDGSLLGIIRDGTFIPWDHDVDIGIPAESVKRILDLKYHFLPRYLLRPRHTDNTWMPGTVRSIKIKTVWEKMMHINFHIDLFVKYKVNNYYHWIDSDALKCIECNYYDNLEKITWEGRSISIPSNPEDYLAIRYNDWRTPNMNFSPSRDDGAVAEKGF
jgi:phosphorylcholine metabolism protein LicD